MDKKYKFLGHTQGSPIEVLTDSGWENTGSPIPERFYHVCSVAFGNAAWIIVGGEFGTDSFSPKSYIFSAKDGAWLPGDILKPF